MEVKPLLLGRLGQFVLALRAFPREPIAAKVPAGGSRTINRTAQVEVLDNAARAQREEFANDGAEFLVADLAGPLRIDVNADGIGDADGVGDLDFAAVGQAGGDDVLGHVPRHVSRAAVNLGRVLAAKRSAAVTAPTAVRIDDDLAPSQTAVAVRSADDKVARRIDMILDLATDEFLGQGWDDHLVLDKVVDRFLVDIRSMLRRQDASVDPDRFEAIVFDRDLALGIGAEPVDFALLPGFGHAVDNPMRQRDRQRHQFRRVIARVPEHHPLVAGTFAVNPHRDVRALAVELDVDLASLGIEAKVVVCVTDGRDDVAGDLFIIDRGGRCDFAGQDAVVSRDQRFASDSALGVLGEQGVEDAVGDLISQLVRMAHADRFTSKEILAGGHDRDSWERDS